MKIQIVLIICLIFVGPVSQAQQQVDSLLNILNNLKDDTNRVNTLNAISQQFSETGDLIKTKKYADEALQLSQKLGYKKGEATAYLHIGIAHELQGKFQEALDSYLAQIKVSREIDYKVSIANGLYCCGNIYCREGNYDEALNSLSEAEKIYKEIGDTEHIGNIYFLLGIIQNLQSNYTESLKNFLLALDRFEDLDDKLRMASAYNNIGSIYMYQSDDSNALQSFSASLRISKEIGDKIMMTASYNNIGNILRQQGQYDKSFENLMASKAISEEIGDPNNLASTYLILGETYFDQKKYDAALENYTASLKLSQEIGDNFRINNNYRSIAKIYALKGQHAKAIDYFNKSLAIAKELEDASSIIGNYEGLSKTYESLGDFKQALHYHKLFKMVDDSIFNETKNEQLTEMRTKYETDQKDKEITLLHNEKELQQTEIKRQKLLKYSFIGGLALTLLSFLFGYRTYRTRQVLRLQDIRNKIAGDLHDDIGSTLNSISVYSEVARRNDEQRDEALEMIGDSSRKIIDAMSDIVWTINPDNDNFSKIIFRMKSLAHNLFRAKSIEYTFHVDDILNEKKLSLEERRNFYLIFKEAINNLVKYADAHHVSIVLSNDNNHIQLHIQDDGVGFEAGQHQTGNGLKSMKRRADEIKAVLAIVSMPGHGTQIDLTLKT